ncbi:MBOAT family O-acyltransferase [Paenibacillus gyeongsangnamensis]
MLFNSMQYIFFFLPGMLAGYYLLQRTGRPVLTKLWLLGGSLFFYSSWNAAYLPVLLGSIVVNYAIGTRLMRVGETAKKRIITAGILLNVGLLGYYKYSDFIIGIVNDAAGLTLPQLHLTLPLAISFFTFEQISYLVDCYRGKLKNDSFLHYAMFIAFFPKLIAGPILLFKELEPQLAQARNPLNEMNLCMGLYLFFIGLFKKVVLADTYAVWATEGFDRLPGLTLIDGWAVSLSYSFQLYFDFSGYSDMALGAALMMNIRFPVNFNSPIKARNIQDFWQRWHMTLSRFLFTYVYVPLSRFMYMNVYRRLPWMAKEAQACINIILLFLISGLWHGAGFPFLIWGLLHGVAYATHRIWKKAGFRLPGVLAWLVTLLFINCTSVFFRAKDWASAMKVFKAMFGCSGVAFSHLPLSNTSGSVKWIAAGFLLVLLAPNSNQLTERFEPNWRTAVFFAVLAVVSIVNLTKISEFLYFQF